jgi:hypothetical protein
MRAFLRREEVECKIHHDVDGLISISLKAPRRKRILIESPENLELDPFLAMTMFARIVERQLAANEDRLVWGRLIGMGSWGTTIVGGVAIHVGMRYQAERSVLHSLQRSFGPRRFARFTAAFCS